LYHVPSILILRIDDNTKPIIFLENTDLLKGSNNPRFIDERKILDATDWSKDLSFVFPNTGSGSVKENVAYYIQLNYFRQEYNPSSSNTVLKNENYFNLAFCPIDLPNLGNLTVPFQMVFNHDWNYLNGILPNTGKKFGYIADSGAYWDSNRILFYSQAVFAHQITGNFYTNKGIKNKFSLDNEWYNMSYLKTDVNINCISLEENNASFKSIAISYADTGFIAAKENLLLLGIALKELQSLQNAASEELSPEHHQYLFEYYDNKCAANRY